jgi:hypothetical protein
MSKVLLESRWDETKEALLEGLKGTRRSTMGVILENTKKQLLAESSISKRGCSWIGLHQSASSNCGHIMAV